MRFPFWTRKRQLVYTHFANSRICQTISNLVKRFSEAPQNPYAIHTNAAEQIRRSYTFSAATSGCKAKQRPELESTPADLSEILIVPLYSENPGGLCPITENASKSTMKPRVILRAVSGILVDRPAAYLKW